VIENGYNLGMIESPCIRVCCLDENDICLGCYRSIDDVLQWSAVDDTGKLLILEVSEKRRKEKSER